MKPSRTKRIIRSSAVVAVATLAGTGAFAAEGGGTIYPLGVENWSQAAVPPPGIYGMVFGQHYSADRVNGPNGNNLNVPGFKVTADVIAPRFIWVPNVKLLGGQLVTHAILPIVNLQVKAAGASQTKTGIGDMVAGAALGWHHSAKLHTALGLDFFLPTGGYTKGDLANIGRNYYAFEPVAGVSYIDPDGFNADLKAGYIFNARNKDTDYRSGQEFHFDYAVGWGFGHGFTAGVGGYYYQQVTSDKLAGATLANSRARAFAIGPSVRYIVNPGLFFTLKWQKETSVENRAQGSALWLKAVFPL